MSSSMVKTEKRFNVFSLICLIFERDGCSNPRASESEIGPIKVKSLVLKENGEYEWIDSN